MSEMEKYPAEGYRFETLVDEVREPLVEELFEGTAHLGDILDPITEFSVRFDKLWEMSHHLGEMFRADNEVPEEVRAAMYRGSVFGFQVLRKIKPALTKDVSMQYILDVTSLERPAKVIKDDVTEYLELRPGIASLLDTFMPEVDPSHLYRRHIELSAGLIFMLCEFGQAETHL